MKLRKKEIRWKNFERSIEQKEAYLYIYTYIRGNVAMKEIVDESRFVGAMIDYDLSNSK